PAALRQAEPQGAHQLLPAAGRQQRRLGQHRYLRLARLPHADQGGLPVPRFDPGGADRARPGAVPGPGKAGRAGRHPGVAELLFQVAHVRAAALSRARPVHSVDEAEEHVTLAEGRRPDHPPRLGILRLRVAPGSSPLFGYGGYQYLRVRWFDTTFGANLEWTLRPHALMYIQPTWSPRCLTKYGQLRSNPGP